MKLSNSPDPSNPSIAPSASGKQPNSSARPLKLYRRRWTAYFVLPTGIVVCIAGIGFAVIVLTASFERLAIVLVGVSLFGSLCVGIALIQAALQTLRTKGPTLILDERGITHIAKEEIFIAWSAIQRISTNEGEQGDDLGIWFKLDDAEGQRLRRIGTRLKRALIGADKTIPLGNLVYRPKELAATIAAYQSQEEEKQGSLT
ncbi:hypothetical protein [Undibacterium terreum]|uniref:Uncharacterized protein n=1 Tax=Undibacterium terreum TaxID=1224302 RepID=A0A916UA38_9BURK|nr:hypothetical protein [Undibacterium terreum]GGC64645.1 hypothetical protein GCM10011396_09560 [Undibacterium terreum]